MANGSTQIVQKLWSYCNVLRDDGLSYQDYLELAVRFSIDQVAFLVDGAVVPATEQGQVRERGGTAVRPVTDVMPLAEPDPAPREATATVSMVERPP